MLLLAEKFIFLQTKPKRVTQMKVLGEYIIVAMFTEELVRTRDNNPRFMNINIIIIIYDHFFIQNIQVIPYVANIKKSIHYITLVIESLLRYLCNRHATIKSKFININMFT